MGYKVKYAETNQYLTTELAKFLGMQGASGVEHVIDSNSDKMAYLDTLVDAVSNAKYYRKKFGSALDRLEFAPVRASTGILLGADLAASLMDVAGDRYQAYTDKRMEELNEIGRKAFESGRTYNQEEINKMYGITPHGTSWTERLSDFARDHPSLVNLARAADHYLDWNTVLNALNKYAAPKDAVAAEAKSLVENNYASPDDLRQALYPN